MNNLTAILFEHLDDMDKFFETQNFSSSLNKNLNILIFTKEIESIIKNFVCAHAHAHTHTQIYNPNPRPRWNHK